jgi:hypothetical protein
MVDVSIAAMALAMRLWWVLASRSILAAGSHPHDAVALRRGHGAGVVCQMSSGASAYREGRPHREGPGGVVVHDPVAEASTASLTERLLTEGSSRG